MNDNISRRSFVAGTGALLLSKGLLCAEIPEINDRPLPTPGELKTPYKLGSLVLKGSAVAGAFDEKAVDCPFVFRGDDRFYMTMVGFDGTGYQTGLASSDDLIQWKREGCILHRDPQSAVTRYNIAMTWILRENDIFSAGKAIKVDGRYLGVWHAYPNAGYEAGPAVIGLCWSKDLLHWTVDAPCLHSDDADTGPWEQGGLYKPCIVKQGDMYYIFYNAKTKSVTGKGHETWFEQTGMAMSKDLKTWKRCPKNPLIHNGSDGAWDSHFSSDPCVLQYRKQWAFFYFGLSSTDGKARELLAISNDLTSPRKTDSILIDVGPAGTIDDDYAHKPSVITHNGMLYHFYCAVGGKWPNDIRGISVARSKPW
jgi:predicted GH43/DUF377 family glycosyl hydrolase